jgi:hypothetical protein
MATSLIKTTIGQPQTTEVLGFINGLERPMGTYLYGRTQAVRNDDGLADASGARIRPAGRSRPEGTVASRDVGGGPTLAALTMQAGLVDAGGPRPLAHGLVARSAGSSRTVDLAWASRAVSAPGPAPQVQRARTWGLSFASIGLTSTLRACTGAQFLRLCHIRVRRNLLARGHSSDIALVPMLIVRSVTMPVVQVIGVIAVFLSLVSAVRPVQMGVLVVVLVHLLHSSCGKRPQRLCQRTQTRLRGTRI